MKFLTATLILLVSSAAAAQDCKTCSMGDACIKTYVKATSEAQTATKQAIRDWKQHLDLLHEQHPGWRFLDALAVA